MVTLRLCLPFPAALSCSLSSSQAPVQVVVQSFPLVSTLLLPVRCAYTYSAPCHQEVLLLPLFRLLVDGSILEVTKRTYGNSNGQPLRYDSEAELSPRFMLRQKRDSLSFLVEETQVGNSLSCVIRDRDSGTLWKIVTLA